ncbi:MAG TPA: hypothetical protein VFR55_05220 [Dehalococcoidia bacterium]|nr:hypothetical protein [Dehalococcoidia bacterium]
MKSAKLFLGLLAIALVLLVPGLAHAQIAPNDDAEGRLRGFEGEVVNGAGVPGDGGDLTIRDRRTGEERVIRMSSVGGQPNFSIKTPGNSDVSDVARSMKPGVGVAVLARRAGGQWMAVEVLVKPQGPSIAPRTGVVMDSNPEEGTITILTANGITRTLQLQAGAPVPAAGDVIIAFAGPGHPISSSAGLERVTGLTRAADVRERLERGLEEVISGKSDLNGADPTVKAKHAESLMDLLDHQSSSHVERLKKALERSTSRNQRALVEAIVRTKDARKQGRIKAEEARATISKAGGRPAGTSAARDAEAAVRDAQAARDAAARDAKAARDAQAARDAAKAARDAEAAAARNKDK